MKSILSLVAAGLIGTTMMTAPSQAQLSGSVDADIGVGGQIGAGDTNLGNNTNVDATIGLGSNSGTSAEVLVDSATGAELDLQGLQLALDDSASASAMLRTWSGGEVRIIDISSLEGAAEAQLAATLMEYEQQMAEIQAAIGANAHLASALESEGIDASAVVAASLDADGSLRLFTSEIDATATAAIGAADRGSGDAPSLARGFFMDEAQSSLINETELNSRLNSLSGEERALLSTECESMEEASRSEAWKELCERVQAL